MKLGRFPREIHCSLRKLHFFGELFLFLACKLFLGVLSLFHGELPLFPRATCLALAFCLLFLGEVVFKGQLTLINYLNVLYILSSILYVGKKNGEKD
jgi:hypothetical protein